MGVIVLGMHRSGTSALTRVVSLLGFYVGEENDLVEATDANPSGHWEIEALSLFNEDVLVELGAKWSAPTATTAEDIADLAAGSLGDRGRELFDAAFGGRPFVWKDPRLCLLMPFWRRVLPDPPVVITSVRNPLEVARSLGRRNDMLPQYAMALWERYHRRVITDTAGLPGYIVDYAELLARPTATSEALGGFVDRHDLRREGAAPVSEIESFLDDRLHRQHQTDADFRAAASPSQVELFDLLVAAAGAESRLTVDDLPAETPGLQLAFDEHLHMADFENLAIQQRNGIEELLGQIQQQLDGIEALQKWLAESKAETAQTWSEVRRLESENVELQETKSMILDYLERVIADRDELRRRFERIKRLPPVRLGLAARERLQR